jgi:hypothetical protein
MCSSGVDPKILNGKNFTRELEVDRLPPLDYVWYFAQKVHYYHKLFAKRDFCDSNGACAHGALLEKKTAGFCQGTMCGRVNVEA